MVAAAGAPSAAGAAAASPVSVGHPRRFVASIHGSADRLVYVDVDDPSQSWKLDVRDGIQDFQLIGQNKLLVGYKFNFGYMEVDLATHKVAVEVRDFLTKDKAILTSVKRLANGHTLIMAQGLESGASSNLEVWEVDNDKTVHQKRTFKACCGNLRVVRVTGEGHFLVGSDSALVELDESGKEVARMPSGGSPTYMGLKTADGTYYATNGHGGQLVAIAAGGQKRVIGGRGSASAKMVTIYQPGQFQILQNGHIVITNWTAEDGGMGKQLVEYDPEGNMLWSWDDPMVRPQGMETLLVLDNLDPAVLNDDRDGVLQPRR
jgi:outer membrane protein assembly factor BamB